MTLCYNWFYNEVVTIKKLNFNYANKLLHHYSKVHSAVCVKLMVIIKCSGMPKHSDVLKEEHALYILEKIHI